jgi:biotin carboxyl carrier protein
MAEAAEPVMTDINLSDPAVIGAISEALTQAGVDGIEIERGAQKLRIVVERDGTSTVTAARATETSLAKAPLAGVFQAIDGPLPRHVAAGDTLGFVRVGPIVLPVKAAKAGMLIRTLAEKDRLVGYGDPLFEIEPNS